MKLRFIYLLMLCACTLQAQFKTDTVRTLPEVVSRANSNAYTRTSYRGGGSLILARTLSDALRENTALYLKNYGNGQLSSITVRGASASQTDVLWNGVKLNSPSLGQVDFSLFTMGNVDQIELSGASRGGNVGGYINMINQSYLDSGVSLRAEITYGSFNTLRTMGKVTVGKGKVRASACISYLTSNNDYSFINTYKAGNPKEKLSNAKVQLLNFMHQLNFRPNERNKLNLYLWISDAQRQIPPVISKAVSRESQDDYSLRTALSWKGNFGKVSTEFTSAWLHDVIHYRNPEIYLNQRSTMQALRNNFKVSVDSLKKFSVYVAMGYDLERAVVPSYVGVALRSTEKLLAGVNWEPVKDLRLQLELQESVAGKVFSPFSPRLAMSYYKEIKSGHWFNVFANTSRSYRFPTLNDLYWVPGGNPQLKTEKGWDGEVGTRYGIGGFSIRATGFCKYITNWIQWIPTGSYWQPMNVKRVLTRGIEASIKAEGTLTYKLTGYASLNYAYTRATNLDAITPGDQSQGKQLIYVPLHAANLVLHLDYKDFYIRAINNLNDAVYITTDNRDKLKPWYLLDLEIGKNFTVKRCEVSLAFRVNNVTGEQYQTVAQRPMPGRNFEGTLRFKFN